MDQQYIGEISEITLYREFLMHGFEIYRANSRVQKGWDLVVLVGDENNIAKRIQVKTVTLQNNSTNNDISFNLNFDFLIIVVVGESNNFTYYLLTKKDIINISTKRSLKSADDYVGKADENCLDKKIKKMRLSISRKEKNSINKIVREDIKKFEIRDFSKIKLI